MLLLTVTCNRGLSPLDRFSLPLGRKDSKRNGFFHLGRGGTFMGFWFAGGSNSPGGRIRIRNSSPTASLLLSQFTLNPWVASKPPKLISKFPSIHASNE